MRSRRYAVEQHVPRPRHSLLPVQSTPGGNRPAGPGYGQGSDNVPTSPNPMATPCLAVVYCAIFTFGKPDASPRSNLPKPILEQSYGAHPASPKFRTLSFPTPRPEADVSCSARSRLKAYAAFCPGHCLLSTRVKPGRKGRLFSADHPRSSRNICILPSGLPADLPQSWLALMPDYDSRHSSLSLPPSLVVVLARGQGGEWEMSSLRWLLCSIC
ncbi:hypothetical protein IWX49DRAFT_250299 [Phyllosticta citricarpa]|uniref:Uncharacterized protein n=1 Tax=Phyllosticta paracitricarpa TaxID=2016321 RepID=A0ABR1N6X5_9PEZI